MDPLASLPINNEEADSEKIKGFTINSKTIASFTDNMQGRRFVIKSDLSIHRLSNIGTIFLKIPILNEIIKKAFGFDSLKTYDNLITYKNSIKNFKDSNANTKNYNKIILLAGRQFEYKTDSLLIFNTAEEAREILKFYILSLQHLDSPPMIPQKVLNKIITMAEDSKLSQSVVVEYNKKFYPGQAPLNS